VTVLAAAAVVTERRRRRWLASTDRLASITAGDRS
jgi:hypothetical protein